MKKLKLYDSRECILYHGSMRVLGIDPGLSTAGIGLIEVDPRRRLTALDWLTIETSPGLPLHERLRELGEDLEAYVKAEKPDIAVVEELFFATNKRTAMDVSHARGVILFVLTKHGIPIRKATPLQLKTAITGDGKADKKQMQKMVMSILELKEIPSPADAADALALAIYGSTDKI